MTVYLHPTAMSLVNLQRIQLGTGLIAVIESSGRRARLVKPQPKLSRPTRNNNWPFFGGGSA